MSHSLRVLTALAKDLSQHLCPGSSQLPLLPVLTLLMVHRQTSRHINVDGSAQFKGEFTEKGKLDLSVEGQVCIQTTVYAKAWDREIT